MLRDAPSCYATRQGNLNILLENSSSGESCLSRGKCHGEVRHCERMWPYAKTSEEDDGARNILVLLLKNVGKHLRGEQEETEKERKQ